MFRATIGKTAKFISAQSPVEVLNAAGAALFYKEADDVDSGDTELAAGASVQITSGQYFISASTSEIVVRELKTEAVEDLTVADDLAVTDDLTVGGDAAVTGAVSVTGKTTAKGELEVDGDLNHDGTKVGFMGSAPVAASTVKKAELTANELATELAKMGLVKIEA
jgi:hypothetical protein